MVKKKNITLIISRLFIITLIIIGIFLIVKDTTRAIYGKVLEGKVNVAGAIISIIDTNGNEIQATTDGNGYYKIEADIDTSKKYDVKLQLKYGTQKFKCTSMEQQPTYEYGEKTKNARIFNISSVIKDNMYATEHQIMSNKLKTIGNNVHVGYGKDLNTGIQSIGDSLILTNVTNVIIYFGTMTNAEREERNLKDSMTGNPIPIIELGDVKTADEALKKLHEQGFINIKNNTTTIEEYDNYAIGKNIIVGENSILNCILEEIQTDPGNLGSGSASINISGVIGRDDTTLTGIDYLGLKIYNSNTNNVVVDIRPEWLEIKNDGSYSVDVHLNYGESYYIEYIFTEEAWKNGFGTQEYFVDDLGTFNNGTNLINKSVKTNDRYLIDSTQTRREQIQNLYKSIDEAKESELDEYNNTTKLIARTDIFSIDKWQVPVPDEINGGTILVDKYTENIESSFDLEKRPEYTIKLENKVSGIKMVLPDGKTFLKEPQNNSTGVDFRGLDFKVIHMDDEIIHGATVYVEYTIDVIIQGDMNQVEYVTITNLLDDAESNGGKQRNIYYDPSCELITEDGINDDYNWEVEDGNKKVKIILDKNDNKTLKIVTSQIITEDCEAAYRNIAYIETYKTNTGRRNGVFGNYLRAGINGETRKQSEEIKILPPFGKK